MIGITKRKISVSVNDERLATAVELTGQSNVSAVLDAALAALIERERERRWLEAHPPIDLPGQVIPDLSALPWDSDASR
jgi:post-segregation antitoxin (ccd killing protein)